jgi:DoxX-like family
VATAILLVVRTILFACTTLLTRQSVLATMGGISGDMLGFLFGVLFGLAARRRDARELLTSSTILSALLMSLAFTFALAGAGKAVSMASMTEFFQQSGYPVSFLKFIMIAEIFGGLGLLLRWAVVPSLIGLTIDMFGAMLTHIHNCDPLNDSTGAIGLLVRLFVVGVLWQLSRRNAASSHSVRRSILGVTGAACVCLLIALAGGAAMRHINGRSLPPNPSTGTMMLWSEPDGTLT